MSDQFNREIMEERRPGTYGMPSGRHATARGDPFFTGGDLLAFVLAAAMIWGPLALGALRA